jgi:hypothetical protein
MKSRRYINTIIVGGGPCGITLANALGDDFNFIVLIPIERGRSLNRLRHKHSDQDSEINQAPSAHWGNQHDTNIERNFINNSSISDLPGFTISAESLRPLVQKLQVMGWPKAKRRKQTSKKNIGSFHYAHISKVKSKFMLNRLNRKVASKIQLFSDLVLIKKEKTARGSTYVISVDGVEIVCTNLVFATGGISNVYYANKSLKCYYPEIVYRHKMIGKGYSNHPKAIIGKVEFKRYIKFMNFYLNQNQIFSWYQMCEQGLYSFRFHPLITELPLPLAFLERFAIRVGFGKRFHIMAYAEYPQMRNNRISMQETREVVILRSEIKAGKREFVDKFQEFTHKVLSELERDLRTLSTVSFFEHDKRGALLKELFRDQYHYFGGTRMGNSFSNSVVDDCGKMHGTSGIYFIGTSVLPVSRPEHPTYIAMALALRAAESIKGAI